MRHVMIGLGALVAALTANLPHSNAAPRPWCSREGGNYPVCLYATFQQCYESVKGVGGYCVENPAIAWQRLQQGRQEPVPKRRRDRHD